MTPPAPCAQQSNRNGAWRLWAGAAVSLLFLWLAFRGVDWRGAWASMAQANGWLLLIGLASVVAGTVLRAERWRLMFFPDHRRVRLGTCVSTTLIGQALNAISPLRAGEVARALYVGEIAGVSRALALWTTVLEKALDSAALLLYLAVASALMPLPGWVRGAGWTLTAALIAGGAALWVLARYEAWSAARLAWLEARFPFLRRARPQRLVGVVLASIRLLRQPRHAIGLGLRSALLFALQSSTNAVIGLGMGLHLPFTAYALLYSILQISAIVPLPTSPGRLGVFHYLCVLVLALYGAERDAALAYGLVLHGIVYLPTALAGPLLLWHENRRGHTLARLLSTAPIEGPPMEL